MQVNQESVRQTLNRKFLENKAINSAYSIRAYARRLKISSGALSAILNGKRAVSLKLGRRLSLGLGLSPKEEEEMLLGSSNSLGERSISRLEEDQFRAIVEWYHFAILSLAKTKGFKSDPRWIAGRLGIKELEVESALKRLSILGLLMEDQRGALKLRKMRVETSNNIKSAALRLTHLNNLKLAQRSLEEDDLLVRDFSAITFSFSADQLSRLQNEIRAFQDKILSSYEKPANKEVYKMCVQVFPLTRSE